jgi:branched-subunit amino acid transport protein
MFLVTYPCRVLPILVFNRRKPPAWAEQWLKRVPLAIFSALLVQIIAGETTAHHALPWALLISLAVTLLLTCKTRSFGWGVGVGFPLYIVLHLFI